MPGVCHMWIISCIPTLGSSCAIWPRTTTANGSKVGSHKPALPNKLTGTFYFAPAHDPDYRAARKDFDTFADTLTAKIIDKDATVPELPVKDIVRSCKSSPLAIWHYPTLYRSFASIRTRGSARVLFHTRYVVAPVEPGWPDETTLCDCDRRASVADQ